MSEHEKAAKALRLMADAVERDPDSRLTGELTLTRTIYPSREEIDRWVRSGQHYRQPQPEDNTTKLTFAIELEAE